LRVHCVQYDGPYNSEEIFGKSMQEGTRLWRVAYIQCLSLFGLLLLPPKAAKSREIRRKFELIAVQGHRPHSIVVSVESAFRIMQLPTSH